MQPSPRAETSKWLFPSFRFFMSELLFFDFSDGANLHHIRNAVAPDLARPVVILLESTNCGLHQAWFRQN
jgi:hypothetical protein